MRTTIKAKVHILPADKILITTPARCEEREVTIAKGDKTGILYLFKKRSDWFYGIEDMYTPQHLYFTTDEEIKEGDKVLHDGEVKTAILLGMFLGFKWKDADKDRSEHFDKHNWPKKIVATTNPELWKNKWTSGEYEPSTPFQSITQGIPKIDIPFIEAYIKAYNEGNMITSVFLEIEENN